MGKYTFVELDKSDTEQILPNLFSILYTNMNRIAPSGCSYSEDEAMWLAYMEQQMHLPYPKVILMYLHDALAGYFQYSVSGNTLMVDEVEIKHEYIAAHNAEQPHGNDGGDHGEHNVACGTEAMRQGEGKRPNKRGCKVMYQNKAKHRIGCLC